MVALLRGFTRVPAFARTGGNTRAHCMRIWQTVNAGTILLQDSLTVGAGYGTCKPAGLG